jgi:hypothetical protein
MEMLSYAVSDLQLFTRRGDLLLTSMVVLEDYNLLGVGLHASVLFS